MLYKFYRLLDRFLFLIISFGILLPTMHQSGLGGLAVVMGQKISPLWQSPLISLHHLISCIAMGYGCVIVTELMISKDYTETSHMAILSRLAKVMRNFMFVFLVLRLSEVLRTGAILQAFAVNLDGISFWTEMLLIGGGIYMTRDAEARMIPKNIFLGSCLTMAAGSLYRINVYIIGFHPAPNVSYFPSVPELSISLGMICLQLALFITIIKTFPIVAYERR